MRKAIKLAALILFQLCFLELTCYAVGLLLQTKMKMYKPPPPAKSAELDYETYLAQRDPFLGWPGPGRFGGAKYDETGARKSPAPDTMQARVSLYGDSFTFAEEVDDEHAWGNLLAQELGCRVANYGTGGYGSDQAYLRFVKNTGDRSSVVILGHLSENILRNLTRDRDLLTYTRSYALKPRFVLDPQGELTLLEMPRLDETEYLRSVDLKSPFLPVKDESFQPGGPAGATRLEFPFFLSILRNTRYFRMKAWLHRWPEYAQFYKAEDPLHGARITRGILEAFTREAERRGKVPLVVLFPTREDISYYRRTGGWTYENLVTELRAAKLEFLDFGPRLLEEIGERDARGYFMPGGHYSPEVNALVADFLYERLRQLEVLKGNR